MAGELAQKKLLMVGAGGIGCELLKTLVLTGFEDIEMVDMDTIETSNLNRQFLFRKKHVGSSKAQVARESVLRFRPNARIVAHFDNVKSETFNVDFFRRFDVVLNGLDNLDARRHVNRMCLAAGVPLVESGTAGYLGQVSVHVKDVTQCFECEPKAVPKTFPVCTIRNTPERPIHCIVWAKDMLFSTLFGAEGGSDLEEADEPPAVGDDGEPDPAAETKEQRSERAAFFVRREGEGATAFAARIFGRAFGDDIARLLRITSLWEKPGRVAPTPLPPCPAQAVVRAQELLAAGPPGGAACASLGLRQPQTAWSEEEAASVFLLSCARLAERQGGAPLTFDKDDTLAVEFVAAAAQLRGASYRIPALSLFAAKGMAGNIIHAIATTNAVIAGLIVMEALKVLRGQTEALRNVYLQQFPSGGRKGCRLLVAEQPSAPGGTKCYVCGLARMELALDLGAWTLGALLERVLTPNFQLLEPTLMGPQRPDGSAFVYESGEAGLEEDEVAANAALRARLLTALPGGGLRSGDILAVTDQATSLEFQLLLTHRAVWDAEKEPDGFEIVSEGAARAAPAEAGPAEPAAAEDEDDCLIMEEGAAAAAPRPKRAREEGGEAAGAAKRARAPADEGADDDIIEL